MDRIDGKKIIEAVKEVNNVLSKLVDSLDVIKSPPMQDPDWIRRDPTMEEDESGLPIEAHLRIGDKFVLRYKSTAYYNAAIFMLCSGPSLINQDTGLLFDNIRDYPHFMDDEEITLGDLIADLPSNFEIVAYIRGPLHGEN